MPRIDTLLEQLVAARGSDLHLSAGAAPMVRVVQRFGPVELTLPAAAMRVGMPFPNPMRGVVRLEVRGGEDVHAVVIDASGRLVRALAAPVEGTGVVEWDGILETGAEAPAGIYFLHLRGTERSVTRRVVRLGS